MPFVELEAFCDRALPAADLEAGLVRPSLRVLDAAVAALGLVCLDGDFVCDRALAAADFEAAPVDFDVSVCEDLLAAFLLVTFGFLLAIMFSSFNEPAGERTRNARILCCER